jgi:hypothetical protein
MGPEEIAFVGERALVDGLADIDRLVSKLGDGRVKSRVFCARRRGLLRPLPGLAVGRSGGTRLAVRSGR